MEDNNSKMQRFFTACDELISGKYILADTKIGELLRSVATCDDLTGLFAAVTEGFDYAAAKKAYLRAPESSKTNRGEAFLPSDKSEVLAFVFCLLVEFDSGSMKLSDFLLRYFYEDGSFTASYGLFAERMIRPFRDIVRSCFPDVGKWGDSELYRKKEDGILEALSEKVAVERSRIAEHGLAKENAVAGEMILAELSAAVGRKDVAEVKALLCGYLYYLQVVDASDENSNQIFLLAGEL